MLKFSIISLAASEGRGAASTGWEGCIWDPLARPAQPCDQHDITRAVRVYDQRNSIEQPKHMLMCR